MNRFPELKAFLLEGEAERYQGVNVTFVAGRTAVMTIYQDGVEQEQITLHTLETRADMHQMMKQKGFVLKVAAPEMAMVEEMRKLEDVTMDQRQEQLLKRRDQTKTRIKYSRESQYAKSLQGMIAIGVVAAVAMIGLRRKRRIARAL